MSPPRRKDLSNKFCPVCRKTQSRDKFAIQKGAYDGLQSACRLCANARQAKYYQKHRDKRRREAREKARKQYQIIEQAKNRPCMDCDIWYSSYVMDFDHVRGTKAFAISKSGSSVKLERLKAEIEKCDVVCSNCHRERTYRRKHDPTC